jgi:hypothetical protein
MTSVVPFVHADDRLPIPDEAAQKASLELITEGYKSDYDQAKTPQQKITLAKKLLQDGIATKNDPAGRYVLLRVARDIAAQGGDVDTAFEAIAEIYKGYKIDTLKMKSVSVADAAKAQRTAKDHQQLVPRILTLIGDAVAADRYDLAKPLGEIAFSSARSAKDTNLIKQVRTRNEEAEEIEKEFVKAKEALTVLEIKPTDSEANLNVGKFRCFVKGDWARGIPMLALGSDDSVKALAVKELADKPDALALGDSWWELAEKEEGTAKGKIQAHAAEWYRKALPDLEGLAKVKVEKRLASVDDVKVSPAESLDDAANRLRAALVRAKSNDEFSTIAEEAIKLSGQARLARSQKLSNLFAAFAVHAAWKSQDTKLAARTLARLRKLASSMNTIQVNSKLDWQHALDVKQGDIIVVNAIGSWHTWPDGGEKWKSDADGTPFKASSSFPLPRANQGALIGRLLGSPRASVFLVGRFAILEVEHDGTLRLMNNDDRRRTDNKGSLSVGIIRLR